MARINVEDHVYTDPRFLRLSEILGSNYLALGMLVYFWANAQRRWGRGELVPKDESPSGWSALIESGWAEERETGIYARGAEEHFAWYRKRVGAGKKGGDESSKQRASKTKQTPSKRNPLTLTLSLTKKEEYIRATDVAADAPTLPSFAPATRDAAPPLLDLWNCNCAPLARARALSTKRQRAWNARWTDVPDREYWVSVIQGLASSEFCRGSTGWAAGIDFLLKPDTHLKVMEGAYGLGRGDAGNGSPKDF